MRNFLTSAPSRRFRAGLAVVFAGCLLFVAATPAPAQTLVELGAANEARNQMIGGGSRNQPDEPNNRDEGRRATTPDPAPPEPAARDSSGPTDKWDDAHSIFRQRLPSLSWWKALLVGGFFLAWVRSCDWVNRDAQLYELGHDVWNPAMVAPFAVVFLLIPLIPVFPITLGVLAAAWLGPFVAYVVHHNKSVEDHQTVFTGNWFRYQWALVAKSLGMKVSTEKQADYMRGPQVDLQARGGDERTNQANLLTARQSPGYVLVKEVVAEMVARGSNRVLMDYTAEAVNVRYLIDGVWHAGEGRDRESGDVMLAVIKQLANLNVSERRRKQEGEFGAEYQKGKYHCAIASQGVKTGERVVLTLKGGKLRGDYHSFSELGMRDKLRDQWLELMESERGVILFSAMPEGGLTTLTDVGLYETDRLMRDFMAVEDAAEPETDIENVPAHYFDSAQGQSPAEIIPSLSRKYPNVWVVRDFVDAETAKLMMEEVELNRLVITTTHAKEAAEACLRVIQKKAPHKEFARALLGVLNTRLIRTLCPDCKVEYEATPALLKKLGIPPGKVTKFYQPPKAEEVNKPCPSCSGLGYKGRTGLFELLVVDDAFREKLITEPKLDVLRKAARAAGMRTLQEEGVLLVAKGLTSLSELSRVLKG